MEVDSAVIIADAILVKWVVGDPSPHERGMDHIVSVEELADFLRPLVASAIEQSDFEKSEPKVHKGS